MTGADAAGLLAEVAALRREFTTLGERLERAAARMSAGDSPPLPLATELAAARARFAALRERVLALAAPVVAAPDADRLASLHDLEPLLRAVEAALEVERRRARLARARQEALAVLDAVARLAPRDAEVPALAACQAQASAVRARIAAEQDADAEAQTRAWAEAVRPFAFLLSMVSPPAEVDDARWAVLEDDVAQAFGRPLAAAAIRGRIVLRG